MNERVSKYSGIIEAILFAAGEPVNGQELIKVLNISRTELEEVIKKMKENYENINRGLILKQFDDNFQLITKNDYFDKIQLILKPIQKQTVTQKTMETLAIIAYKQPVTRHEIEQIRGVKCDYAIQSLLSKNLICTVGKKQIIGNPSLYGTTDEFLSHFNLESLEDLPEKNFEIIEEEEEI